jgi:hypothetical protein
MYRASLTTILSYIQTATQKTDVVRPRLLFFFHPFDSVSMVCGSSSVQRSHLLSLHTATAFQKLLLRIPHLCPQKGVLSNGLAPARATVTPETSSRASSLLVHCVRLHSFYRFVQHLMAFSSSSVAQSGI